LIKSQQHPSRDSCLPLDYTTKHKWSVRFLLEVTIPGLPEFRTQSSNLVLSWSNLRRDIDRVPAEHLVVILHQLRSINTPTQNAVNSLIRRKTRLVWVQQQMVILVVLANALQLLDNRHTSPLEDLGVTQTRALQHWRCSARATGNDHKFPCLDGLDGMCSQSNHGLELWVRSVFNTDRALGLVEQNPHDFGLDKDMQIWMCAVLELGVEVGVGGVLALTFRRDVAQPSFESVVLVEVLQILDLGHANGFGGLDEVVFGNFGSEAAIGNLDGTFEAVMLLLAGSVVCFELLS
jgi:hypothetical protein